MLELSLLCLLLVAGCLVTVAHRRATRRQAAQRFHWQFSTHDQGVHVHAVPADDGDHIEDHHEGCGCSPWTERFERSDGSYGEAIYHQRMRGRRVAA